MKNISCGVLSVCLLFSVCGYAGQPDPSDLPLPRSKADRELEKDIRNLRESPFFKEIQAAIDKGQQFLFSKQLEGTHWPLYAQNKIGPTVLVTLALIKSGISNRDPRIEKVMDWIEKTKRIPTTTYEATSLLMLLEAYGKMYRKGKEPKGVNPYVAKPDPKKKPDFTFDEAIKKWMEELVDKIETSGQAWEVKWSIPEPKSRKEVLRRLTEIETQQSGETSKRKVNKIKKLYERRNEKIKYNLKPKMEFKLWRWRYYVSRKAKTRPEWDNSNLQYIYLGLKAAKRVGIPVKDRDLWYGSLLHWLETQEIEGPKVPIWHAQDRRKHKKVDAANLYGDKNITYKKSNEEAMARGWGYCEIVEGEKSHGGGPMKVNAVMTHEKHTLTPAGISSLLLIRSVLYKDLDYLAYFEDATEQGITDGFAWLDYKWDVYVKDVTTLLWGYYSYYGLERVGVFAGTELIGRHFWYRELCRQLINAQEDDGNFPGSAGHVKAFKDEINTAWALLVLARGSEPLHDVPKPRASYHVSES